MTISRVVSDVVDFEALHINELVAWSGGRGRHPALEHEYAIVGQVARREQRVTTPTAVREGVERLT